MCKKVKSVKYTLENKMQPFDSFSSLLVAIESDSRKVEKSSLSTAHISICSNCHTRSTLFICFGDQHSSGKIKIKSEATIEKRGLAEEEKGEGDAWKGSGLGSKEGGRSRWRGESYQSFIFIPCGVVVPSRWMMKLSMDFRWTESPLLLRHTAAMEKWERL